MTAETKRYDIIVVGRRQCRPVRGGHRGGNRRARGDPGERAEDLSRRQFPAYPQFPLHA